eukprot:Transcript_28445.p2 GENE.Transcript_28445~~Transcript_28445.p2  ORF type:complete len:187 (+),score=30.69 Transcript_28445:51-563(+)
MSWEEHHLAGPLASAHYHALHHARSGGDHGAHQQALHHALGALSEAASTQGSRDISPASLRAHRGVSPARSRTSSVAEEEQHLPSYMRSTGSSRRNTLSPKRAGPSSNTSSAVRSAEERGGGVRKATVAQTTSKWARDPLHTTWSGSGSPPAWGTTESLERAQRRRTLAD